jgi:hypothetical protein
MSKNRITDKKSLKSKIKQDSPKPKDFTAPQTPDMGSNDKNQYR